MAYNYKQIIGKFGEKLAIKYLTKNGYRIIDSNVKTSYQEIDIVAFKNGLYVFVEVKLRTSNKYGFADESVNFNKINNLKKAIISYITKNNIKNNNIRLDLISIDINRNKKTAKIKHYKSIF